LIKITADLLIDGYLGYDGENETDIKYNPMQLTCDLRNNAIKIIRPVLDFSDDKNERLVLLLKREVK
jgi:hypothetical protein